MLVVTHELLKTPAAFVSTQPSTGKVPVTHKMAMELISGSQEIINSLQKGCDNWREQLVALQSDNIDPVLSGTDTIDADEIKTRIHAHELEVADINNQLVMFRMSYFEVCIAPDWKPYEKAYKSLGKQIMRGLAQMRLLQLDMISILTQLLPQAPLPTGNPLPCDMKSIIKQSHAFWGIPSPSKWN